jgi:hypothetical protein
MFCFTAHGYCQNKNKRSFNTLYISNLWNISAVILVQLLVLLMIAQECNAYTLQFRRIPGKTGLAFSTVCHQFPNRNSVEPRPRLAFYSLLASPTSSTPNSSSSSSSSSSPLPVTLTDSTVWKIRLSIRDVKTQKGVKVTTPQIYSIYVKFVESEGYEPPQGSLQQVQYYSQRPGENNMDTDMEQPSSALQIRSSYWKLSEDPKERKDGLWVWGLFKEPYYPFLLLQITTEPILLLQPPPKDAEQGQDPNDTTIPPLQLFCQINHRRDKEQGVLLQGTSDLSIRQMETVQADPFGAATANIYQDVVVGTISIQPCLVK